MLSVPARADFVSIDDFQSYATGTPVDGQGEWSVESGDYYEAAGIANDPDDPSNLVLRMGWGGYNPFATLGHRETINTDSRLTIADGTIATLFLRLRYDPEQVDLSVGMTDIANPISDANFNSFTQFESQLSLAFTPGFDQLRARDGSTFDMISNPISPEEWYSFWFVIDNALDTTQFYIQGGSNETQTLLFSGPQSEFTFRNSGGGPQANDLVTFFIATGRNTDNVAPNPKENIGPVYLDDIYIDTSGENLINPVPEPGTLSLAIATLVTGALFPWGRRSHARNASQLPGR